jgi:formate dehydrogenase subunit gamma
MRDSPCQARYAAWLRRCCTVLLPVALVMLLTSISPASIAAEDNDLAGKVNNPGTQLWNEVRQRDGVLQGTTQVEGMDAGVLINVDGERWRQFRREQMIPTAGLVLGGILGLIILFHLIKRGVPVDGGRSGKYLHRFRDVDRILHWTVASIFIFLALTGLILFAGRMVLIPLVGESVFGALASASKEGHNLFGPLFILGILGLFVRFISKNFLARGDIGWIFKGGGFFGGKHPTAGFFNMGEKIWFWAVIVIGLLISVTGLILEFPFFGQTRTIMALSLVLHGIGAVLLIGGSFGHIYVGTAGMKGSLDSMTKGYVDLNWARQHHDQWAAECEARGEVLSEGEVARIQGQSTLGEVPEPVIKGES